MKKAPATQLKIWKTIVCILCTGSVLAGEPILTVEPCELRGISGEPLQLEISVETDCAAPIQLRIPPATNLVLRRVETIPIRLTKEKRYIQKRIIIWQGIEAGSITLTNLTVTIDSKTLSFPPIDITVDSVELANPPRPSPSPSAGGGETNRTNSGTTGLAEVAI